MILCWVDINQKTGRVQDFSRQQNIDTGLAVLNTFPSPSPVWDWCKPNSDIFRAYHDIFTSGWAKMKKKTGKSKNALKNRTVFSHVSKFCCHVSNIWYMAVLGIYFISRMSREKMFGPENHPDRSGNTMVGPEKNWAFKSWQR